MNLIEKWKNRETKKKLREENMKLKEMLLPQWKNPALVRHRQVKLEKVSAITTVPKYIPENYINSNLSQKIAEKVSPFMKKEIVGEEHGYPDMDIWKGTILVGVLQDESNNQR